jgi:uncharacterized protein YqcC (DUF446 family)
MYIWVSTCTCKWELKVEASRSHVEFPGGKYTMKRTNEKSLSILKLNTKDSLKRPVYNVNTMQLAQQFLDQNPHHIVTMQDFDWLFHIFVFRISNFFQHEHHWRGLSSRNVHMMHQNCYRIRFTFDECIKCVFHRSLTAMAVITANIWHIDTVFNHPGSSPKERCFQNFPQNASSLTQSGKDMGWIFFLKSHICMLHVYLG